MKTTRKRTRDMQIPTIFSWYDAPSGTTSINPSGKVSGMIETIEDNNNRGFRALRKAGLIVLSDVVLTRVNRTVTPGSISNAYTTFSGDITGFSAGGADTSLASTALDSNLQLIATIAKLKESACMSGENLSELEKTIATLRRPFKGVQDLLAKIYKGRVRHLKNTAVSITKANADAWLEYRYGWKPLMMDIDTICQRILVKRGECDRFRLVARGGQKSGASRTGIWGPVVVNGNMSTVGSQTRSVKNRLGVGVFYDIKSQDNFEAWSATLGLRLRDVPQTLWELTPYSFVVDWFVNVGDWLQAVTPVPGLEIRGWWASTVVEEIVETSSLIAWDVPKPTGNLIYNGSFGGDTTTVVNYKRICDQPLAITPTLKLKPLSMLHQADAMALILAGCIRKIKAVGPARTQY